MVNDAIEPSRELALKVKVGQGTIHFQESILGGLLRLLPIPNDAEGDGEGHLLILRH